MKYATLLFAMVVSLALKAQDSTKTIGLSDIRKNNWQLDLDVKDIFDLSNAAIIVKRKLEMGKLVEVNAVKLLRLTMEVNSQVNFTDDPSNDSVQVVYFPQDWFDLTIGFGFEKQIAHKGFVHYFGVDGIFGYYSSDDNNVYPYRNGGLVISGGDYLNEHAKIWRAGVNPFFGIKYYFTKRLSIGIETGAEFAFFKSKITEEGYRTFILNGNQYFSYYYGDPLESKGITTKFNKLRYLTVGYTF